MSQHFRQNSLINSITRYTGQVLIGMLAMSTLLQAQTGSWRTFTNMRQAADLTQGAGTLWVGTPGGVYGFDPQTGSFSLFTNAEGLNQNEVSAVAVDKTGTVWIGLEDGNINLLDPATGNLRIIIDYAGSIINDINTRGDTVYVSLDEGVGEYRLDRGEAKEIYKQLGRIEIVAATATALLDNHLWVATQDSGLSFANLDLPNLKAPQSWKIVRQSQGLPALGIRDLAVFDGQILAATANGIAIGDAEGFRDVSGNIGSKNVQALAILPATLETTIYAATPTGIYSTTDLSSWRQEAGLPASPTSLQVTDGVLWAGTAGEGLVALRSQGWENVQPLGPKFSSYSSLAVDSEGVLWATSAGSGLLAFDGETWYNFENTPELARGDFRKVIVDRADRKWIATWGKGITVVTGPPSAPQIITELGRSDGRLSGIQADASFVALDYLVEDQQGNIWISNFEAASAQPIAVYNPESDQWGYYAVRDGIRSNVITELIVDRFDRIWYATGTANQEGDGVGVIVHGGTPFDNADDDLSQGLNLSENLLSLRINSLAEDQDGTIWIASGEGLNFWFGNPDASVFFGNSSGQRLISENILVVRVDPANNKWLGTSAGISVLGADNNSLTDYSRDNSPLVSNVITDFAFNGKTGDVFIGTTNGLSVLRTPFTATGSDFDALSGAPNPYLPDESLFVIRNLVRNAGVRIFDETGRLMRTFETGTIAGSQVAWDGNDDDGEPVPTGIYIFVAFSESGENKAGKVAVIRR